MDPGIQLLKEDITRLQADAIVNAANHSLLGGGGVDGAIHRAAGPELVKECKTLNGCGTGEARTTNAYNLPAKYVIHTVGPVWKGGLFDEENLLHNCYKNSLQLANMLDCKSIAFPNISTGVYRFPKDKAAEIAIQEVTNFLLRNKNPETVFFVCFDEKNYSIYKALLASLDYQ